MIEQEDKDAVDLKGAILIGAEHVGKIDRRIEWRLDVVGTRR